MFLDLRRFVEMLCLHVREAGTGGRNDESGECAVAIAAIELDMFESIHGSIQYEFYHEKKNIDMRIFSRSDECMCALVESLEYFSCKCKVVHFGCL